MIHPKNNTAKDILAPVHPGEILEEEFLEPMALSAYRLAKEMHVTPIRISQILHGKRAVTADTALRLAQFFGMSAEFWLGLQTQYDLAMAREKSGSTIQEEITTWDKAG